MRACHIRAALAGSLFLGAAAAREALSRAGVPSEAVEEVLIGYFGPADPVDPARVEVRVELRARGVLDAVIGPEDLLDAAAVPDEGTLLVARVVCSSIESVLYRFRTGDQFDQVGDLRAQFAVGSREVAAVRPAACALLLREASDDLAAAPRLLLHQTTPLRLRSADRRRTDRPAVGAPAHVGDRIRAAASPPRSPHGCGPWQCEPPPPTRSTRGERRRRRALRARQACRR